jgi:ubiquinone/menaquinone biosynthesis C-methylase UbiE
MSLDYDSIAATYDRRYLDYDYSGVEQTLVAFVGPTSDGRVLEAGCGTGHWLRVLGDRGIRVAGVDASGNMLAHARVHAPSAALARGKAEQLPWISGAFDRVFCINAFHHFEDKVRCLAEARRVLRPGGQMMTIGLDPHTGLDRWYSYEYFETALENDRRRYSAASQIREWMQGARFSNVYTREVQHLASRLPAQAALDQGRLDKGVASQLALLSDEEYRRGIARIRTAAASAEARGEPLHLVADLRLYATFGSVADS